MYLSRDQLIVPVSSAQTFPEGENSVVVELVRSVRTDQPNSRVRYAGLEFTLCELL